MSTATTSKAFFVAGGTVPPGSPSYVERSADGELYEALVSGEYCHVLNSRQMGKSSLAVRTVARLGDAGIRTAFIDLTRVGGPNVTAEQWFAGLLAETGRVLGLRQEAVAFLRERRELGPAQRFLSFLHEAALSASETPLVVMVDEIDAVRSLSFSTDELFAGIRQLHNGRASESALNKLTFCLLGAALPSDLIRDPRTTPFNVGRRIELRDFTSEEAKPFASAVGPNGHARLERVLYWTGGHPFLTQAICAELAVDTAKSVDDLVKARYLVDRAQETDTNLTDVGNRLLGRGDPDVHNRQRADTLSLYAKMLKSDIQDDESNPSAARIKMSGAARLTHGKLRVRNRIYEQVFDKTWIRDNMPGQELRRQKKAFLKGVLRTGAIAMVVIAIVSTLALLAIQNARRAEALEAKAKRKSDEYRYARYVATMRTMIQFWDQHNLSLIDRATKDLQDDRWKGWEWGYWHRMANRAMRTIALPRYNLGAIYPSPDGRLALTSGRQGLGMIELASGKTLWNMPLTKLFFSNTVGWLRDSRRIVVFPDTGQVRIFDARTAKLLKSASNVPDLMAAFSPYESLPGDRQMLVSTRDNQPAKLDLERMSVRRLPFDAHLTVSDPGDVSEDGHWGVMSCGPNSDYQVGIFVWDLHKDVKFLRFDTYESVDCVRVSPDNHTVAFGTDSGSVVLLDILSGKVVDRRQASRFGIGSVVFSTDGKTLIACGSERESVIFDVLNGKLRERQRLPECSDAGFIPGYNKIYTAFWDLRLYDPKKLTGTELRLPKAQYSGTITPQGELRAESVKGRFSAFLASGGSVTTLRSDASSHSSDDGIYNFRGYRNRVEVIDTRSGIVRLSRPYKLTNIQGCSAGGDHRYVLIPRSHTSIEIDDLTAGAKPVVVDLGSRISASCFSPDGRTVAVALETGALMLLDSKNGERLWNLDRIGFEYLVVSFSPDGKTLAAGETGDRADLVSVGNHRILATLRGHSSGISAFAWSSDGHRLATGSGDSTIHLWDPASGEDLGIVGRHDSAIVSVRFLPGDRTLSSFSMDGVAKLWMTEDRR